MAGLYNLDSWYLGAFHIRTPVLLNRHGRSPKSPVILDRIRLCVSLPFFRAVRLRIVHRPGLFDFDRCASVEFDPVAVLIGAVHCGDSR
jgi:hypothetical protein